MASKQLTATVRLNTKQAERSIDNLTRKINKINTTINKASGNNQTEKQLQNADYKLNGIVQKVRSWSSNQKLVNNGIRTSNTLLSGVGSKLRTIASTYLGLMGTKAMIGISDTVTSAQNKLNYVNANNLGASGVNADGSYNQATFDATKDSMDKMYASSQKVRMGYKDMMANVSKSMALAGDSFQDNTDNAIRFQEIMAEAYAVGGASAQEMHSSMYQMIQALGANVLAGDELRSVREGAPLAYKAIEEFAQGVLDSEESLKELASQGLITADMVVAAIMDAGDQMDKAFAQTNQTFAQTWSQVKNAAIQAFRPVIDMINEMHQKALDNGLLQKAEALFNNVAKAVMIAFAVIKNVVAWIAENWSWIQHIVVAGLIIMASMWLYQGAMAIIASIETLIAMGSVAWMVIIIIAAILALVYIFLLWKNGAIDTCQAIVAVLLIVAMAILLIGILTGSLVMVVIAGVILLVATIVQHLDYFLAFVYSLAAAIWNIVVGIVNGIIQFLWTYFVEPWIGIIEWVLNVFNGGFNSFGDAVKNLLGNIISWFLSLGQVVTKIIDAIFGTDWTGGLNALQDKVLEWGKNENAVTLSREAPEVLNRVSYTDAWNLGMEHGSAAKDWLNELGSKFQTGTDFSLDSLGEKLGLDFSGFGSFPGASDLSGAYSVPEDLLGGIKDDTGDIKDSMELTAEDLEYLRKIAEMEWKKEYTTAEIKIDMSNYNTIEGDGDLDGIVTKLTDKLYEELASVANGVYV